MRPIGSISMDGVVARAGKGSEGGVSCGCVRIEGGGGVGGVVTWAEAAF